MPSSVKDLQGSALKTPGEVPPLSSPGASSDKDSRIERILDLVAKLKGKPDAETVLEDERKNLTAYLNDTKNERLKTRVKELLK